MGLPQSKYTPKPQNVTYLTPSKNNGLCPFQKYSTFAPFFVQMYSKRLQCSTISPKALQY